MGLLAIPQFWRCYLVQNITIFALFIPNVFDYLKRNINFQGLDRKVSLWERQRMGLWWNKALYLILFNLSFVGRCVRDLFSGHVLKTLLIRNVRWESGELFEFIDHTKNSCRMQLIPKSIRDSLILTDSEAC